MSAFNLYYKQLLLEFQENFIQQVIKKFPDVAENIVRFYLTEFERYKQEIPPNKRDPLQYKTFEELEQTVDAIKGNKPRDTKKVQIDVDKNDIVAEDDNVVIYRGDSQDKCIMYGQGYSFCISRRASGNLYSHYRLGKESTFYFIYFKKKSKDQNDHIMVLDHTNEGYEWTFMNNRTQEVKGGWKTIVKNYPELKPYESLLVNKKLEEVERAEVEAVKNFFKDPTIKKFLKLDYRMRSQVLKNNVNLSDDIFDVLSNDLINEFLSIGPNLTPHQVESLKENQIKWYLKNRKLQIDGYIQNFQYILNKLDLNIESIKEKTEEAYSMAYEKIEKGNYNISELEFLIKLPDNIPTKIKGNFKCSNNNLLTLEGAPTEVGGSFNCSNNKLTTLKGAPTKVNGSFNCSNNNLTSLEGAPEVGGKFLCSSNNLSSLNGAPTKVIGDFDCSFNNLTSLEGAPTEVGGDFKCIYNKLISLKGAQIEIREDFNCCHNNLTSLEGAPIKVGGDFNCSFNNLTSLEGAPKEVVSTFDCGNNNLTSLKGAPTEVGDNFLCSRNNLTSLEGAPNEVKNFYCSHNNLTSLKGAPNEVKNFYCSHNNLTSLEGIPIVRRTSLEGIPIVRHFNAFDTMDDAAAIYVVVNPQNNGVNFTDEEIKVSIQDSKKRLERKKLPESTKLSQADTLKSLSKLFNCPTKT